MLKNRKLFYFCRLKKLVRPETFGPHYVRFCALYLLADILKRHSILLADTLLAGECWLCAVWR